VAVWLAAPPTVTADPIAITSGVITMPSKTAVAPVTLTGSDGTRMFTFAGFISPNESYLGPTNCSACTSGVNLGIAGALIGTVTYGDESYQTTYAGVEDGTLSFFVSGNSIPLPVPLTIGETQTFSAPFAVASSTLTPPYWGDPRNPNPGLRNTLTGSGIATVTLVGTPTPIGGGGFWDFVRAEYQFTAPAPIPEPTSFVLFASGLSALVLRRRSRAV
jgi:hypothetical protein